MKLEQRQDCSLFSGFNSAFRRLSSAAPFHAGVPLKHFRNSSQYEKGEVTFRVGRSDHRKDICMRSQALAAVAQRKNHDE